MHISDNVMYKLKSLLLNTISNLGKEVWSSMYFINGNLQMTNELMKRCSILLVIREIQIATTVIFHCTHPLEYMNQGLTMSAGEDVGQLELAHCWGVRWHRRCGGSVWQFLIKLNRHLP